MAAPPYVVPCVTAARPVTTTAAAAAARPQARLSTLSCRRGRFLLVISPATAALQKSGSCCPASGARVAGDVVCCAGSSPPDSAAEPPAPRPRRRRPRPPSLFQPPADDGAGSASPVPDTGSAEPTTADATPVVEEEEEEGEAAADEGGSVKASAREAAGRRRVTRKSSRRPKSYDQIRHLFEIKEPAWYTLLCIPGSEERVAEDFALVAAQNAADFGHVRTLVPLRKFRASAESGAETPGAPVLSVQQQVQLEGYIYVYCERMSDVIVGIVDDIPRAAGLVKERMRMQRSKFAMIPKPVSKEEIAQILALHEESKTILEEDYFVFVGCAVEVIAGPFKGFSGEVVEVDHDRQVAKALLHMFGRETPAQLSYAQLRPLS